MDNFQREMDEEAENGKSINQRRGVLSFQIKEKWNAPGSIVNRRNTISADEDCVLIMDTGADQCTCGGAAWNILDHTGEEIRCDGYLKGQSGCIGPTVQVVSAVICVIQRTVMKIRFYWQYIRPVIIRILIKPRVYASLSRQKLTVLNLISHRDIDWMRMII